MPETLTLHAAVRVWNVSPNRTTDKACIDIVRKSRIVERLKVRMKCLVGISYLCVWRRACNALFLQAFQQVSVRSAYQTWLRDHTLSAFKAALRCDLDLQI